MYLTLFPGASGNQLPKQQLAVMVVKNKISKLHLELATFSCQFSANCVVGKSMEKIHQESVNITP